MNKYLAAIYQGNPNQLEHLLVSCNHHDYNDINAALAVVLQDTDRDVVERLRLVESLLLAGADPNSQGLDNDPLLCRVCTQGEECLARLLLTYACHVNACNDSDRKTPLHVAAGKGNEEVVGLLIEAGASTNAVDIYGDTPLMDMLYSAKADGVDLTNITSLLLVDYRDINSGNMNQLTPLHIAAATNKQAPVELLLSAGASVHKTDLSGETSLFPATQFASVDTVRLLLSAGACVNAPNKDGNTPVHKAITCHRHDLWEAFLHHGANLDAENNCGNSPLITALDTNNIQAVLFLIENNCACEVVRSLPKSSPNKEVSTGSALQMALCKGQWTAAQMLIVAGCRLSATDLNKLSTSALERLSLAESDQVHDDIKLQRRTILQGMLETPLSLRQMCRIAIRRSLNKADRFTVQIGHLNLPSFVTEFLKMNELHELSMNTS